MLDLTSGGGVARVFGRNHPELMAAAEGPEGSHGPAPGRLAERLERATGLRVASFHATVDQARAAAVGYARAMRGDEAAPLVVCRDAALASPGARVVAHGDALQARAALAREPRPAALWLEVVQSRTGVRVPAPDYLARARGEATAAGAWLILDDSDIGFGRLGALVSWLGEDAVPDLAVLSLDLGIVDGAVVLARPDLAVGGGPDDGPAHARAAAVGLAALDLIERDKLVERVRKMGTLLKKEVHKVLEGRRRWCKDSLGRGLLRGLSLWEESAPVVSSCRERGLAIDAAGPLGLLFAPPITADPHDITEAVGVVDAVLAGA